jgi:hypothetical protein
MLFHEFATASKKMKRHLIASLIGVFALPWSLATGQTAAAVTGTAISGSAAPAGYSAQGAAAGPGAPVSYASMTQLNGLLTQLEASSKATQADLTKLRIERWKVDAGSKRQAQGNLDSIQRNLQTALPDIIGQVRTAPEDLPATFKLYRNLDALYDVLGGVVESAGAFGSKDDFQSLSNDLSSFEGTRKQFAERIETLATSKEAEIVRLHADLKAAQTPPPLPKKTVVDDDEPVKKPVVKKKAAPKPATPPAKPGDAPAVKPQ